MPDRERKSERAREGERERERARGSEGARERRRERDRERQRERESEREIGRERERDLHALLQQRDLLQQIPLRLPLPVPRRAFRSRGGPSRCLPVPLGDPVSLKWPVLLKWLIGGAVARDEQVMHPVAPLLLQAPDLLPAHR